METITIPQDIKVFYIQANSYPEGIAESHEKLHELVPHFPNRKYFGISRPENGGKIVYKAAAEELEPGEAEKFKCETLVLKKGKYISMIVKDYMKDLQSIEKAFEKLLDHPDLDPKGYCVELYLSDKEVNCMIRLQN